MTEDAKVHDRLVAPAERLLERTEDDRMSWSPTDNENVFLYSAVNASVTIRSFVGSDGNRRTTLSAHNCRGTEVESLESEYYSDTPDPWTSNSASWNVKLDALYYAARRNALNVDKLLDDLFDEIDNPNDEEEPPFYAPEFVLRRS